LINVDEDFPDQSNDPELQPPLSQLPSQAIGVPEDQDLKILVRLLIGSFVEGSDEFRRRARLWQEELNSSDPSKIMISQASETEAARLRYSIIGFLFQLIDSGYNSLSFLDKVSSQTFTVFSRLFAPLTNSRFWRPVQEHYDSYSERGESIVNSWINTGRREEQMSRALVRDQAYEQVVNEIIIYLARKPEVRELVEQQGISLAEELVGDLRERSNEFDSMLENRVNRLLRRRQTK
jgi:hypothetical protein